MRRRENFSDMLREVHLTKREKITYLSKFYVISKKLQSDIRFKMVDDREREELFQDYIERLGEEEREHAKKVSLENIEKFKKAMKADPNITMDTSWSYIDQEYYQKKKPPVQKEGDQILFDNTQMDLLQAFEEFIKDQEREDF